MFPLASLVSMFSSDVMGFALMAAAAAVVGVMAWNNRGKIQARAQELLPVAGESPLQTLSRDFQAVQRDAVDLSQILADEGLPLTSGLLKDLASGDVTTAAQHLRQILDTLRDPVQRRIVMLALLDRQIGKALAQPAMKTQLIGLLEQKLGETVTIGDPPHAKSP